MMNKWYLNNENINLLIEALFNYFYSDILSTNKDFDNIKIYLHQIISDSKKEEKFINKLDEISSLLKMDVDVAFSLDPASNSKEEIVLTYPGIYALTLYRIAHEMYLLSIPLIPRYISEIAHSKVGIDIHPGACIGKRTFIDHGTGIVIGETAIIGDDCKIYQGVLLGAISLKEGKKLKNIKRHPTIGNNVTLYASCSILGGDTYIGDNSIIGINCIVNCSIKANSIVILKQNRYHHINE